MSLQRISLAASICVATFMAGCGSSSSSTPVLTGVFNDANTTGIDYVCGDQNGTTDSNGTFKYKAGDTCTFSIAGVSIGSAKGASELTPYDILDNNETKALNLAVLLQSLDADGNASNGIDISNNAKKLLTSKFNLSSDTNITSALTAVGLTPKDKDAALAHMQASGVALKPLKSQTMAFAPVATPVTEATKSTFVASPRVTIDGKDYNISYNVLLRTNDVLPKLGDSSKTETFGLVKDKNGNAIKLADGSNFVCRTSLNGSGPDHTTLLTYGSSIFTITQFECSPGAMYITKLTQDTTTGKLTPVATRSVDQSAEFGGFVHCAGIASPWGTHLGSEEYEPDAKKLNTLTGLLPSGEYYNTTGLYFGDQNLSSPYYYGWTPEVKITDANGATQYLKHYSMGRFAHELAYVMPDNKTVYLSDDGANVGLFMYIADVAGDLSAGTLYAAKWVQISSANGGIATIEWINLGHATDTEIRSSVAAKPLFSDLFDEEKTNGSTGSGTGTCSAGYTSINTTAGHECLAIKSGKDLAASRLETRRYAAIKGATTEFNKEEGLTYDATRNRLYVAMSYAEKGMEDNKKTGVTNTTYDKGGNNDIKISYNPCGIVYAMDVVGSKTDKSGTAINSSYVVGNMYSLIAGEPATYSSASGLSANTCNINKIASPDNITYLPKYDTLIIGEDTGEHQNDYMWAYNIGTGQLTRIFTTPYGSETTSPFWYPDLNGFGYLTGVIQHPYGESDTTKKTNDHDLDSYIGYFGPFPKLK